MQPLTLGFVLPAFPALGSADSLVPTENQEAQDCKRLAAQARWILPQEAGRWPVVAFLGGTVVPDD